MSPSIKRRDAIKAGLLAGAGLALGRLPALAQPANAAAPSSVPRIPNLITRSIPSTGERIPVVGLGTNRYNVTAEADIAERRDVIARMPELGGSVIDTARGYGRSEIVIGGILKELGNRDRYFLATKCMAPNNNLEAGITQLREAFERLQVERIDLMMVHMLNGVDVLLPVLREWKADGRLRYIGVSTSVSSDYPRLADLMRREAMDLVQVDYSIGNRDAAETILPLAQDRGMGIMLNVPFGGPRNSNLFSKVANVPLPPWAAEIGAESWAQYFLKFNVSHPAVTVAIPGTTQVRHLEDNLRAAHGTLPDEALRQRMAQHWDSLG